MMNNLDAITKHLKLYGLRMEEMGYLHIKRYMLVSIQHNFVIERNMTFQQVAEYTEKLGRSKEKKEYVVYLRVIDSQMFEMQQMADMKTEAVGLLMLRLGITDALYAQVDDLHLFGIHIDEEVFTWESAFWLR